MSAMIVALAIGLTLLYTRREVVDVWQNFPPPNVSPGGRLVVRREVEWLRNDCTDVHNAAVMIDSSHFEHFVETDHLAVELKGHQFTHREWTVPTSMPYGPTIFRNRLVFNCSPFFTLWPVAVQLPDVEFTIVPDASETP